MKITLLEQWEKMESELLIRDNDFIDTYYLGEIKPEVIWKLNFTRTIDKLPVVGVSMWHPGKPYFDKRPTKKNLEEFIQYLSSYVPKEENIRIQWKIVREGGGSSSSAIKTTDIDDKRYSLFKDNLLPEQERLRQIYEPREGHTPCGYCKKQFPENEKVESVIIGRSRDAFGKACVTREPMIFCSGQCAGYEQMSREG